MGRLNKTEHGGCGCGVEETPEHVVFLCPKILVDEDRRQNLKQIPNMDIIKKAALLNQLETISNEVSRLAWENYKSMPSNRNNYSTHVQNKEKHLTRMMLMSCDQNREKHLTRMMLMSCLHLVTKLNQQPTTKGS